MQEYKNGLRPLKPFQTKDDVGYKWIYNRHIQDIREEEIPGFSKEFARSSIERTFSKETSVFAPWKEDTP